MPTLGPDVRTPMRAIFFVALACVRCGSTPQQNTTDASVPLDGGFQEDAGVIITRDAEAIDAAIDAALDAASEDAIAIEDAMPSDAERCDPEVRPQPNAGLGEAAGEGGCPSGMVSIAATTPFCIDRYEATIEDVLADGSTASRSPYHHPGSERIRARSIAGAVPQGYIDQVNAERACEDAGKRLCTNEEWLRACRGPDQRIYPYGDVRMDGVCNDARAVHPAIELFPDDPTPFDRIQDPCINQLPSSLERTGTRSGCVTAEGVFDMMGNLHEWTSDPGGTFRGGFYVDTMRNGEGCLYVTTAHNTLHWDYSTGFRCCADR
jgi:formylglycine-generating enzyme